MSPSTNGDEATSGLVSLIGAGPGDPKLITLLGLERLRNCQAVVFDRLIPHGLLRKRPPTPSGSTSANIPANPREPLKRKSTESWSKKALKGYESPDSRGAIPPSSRGAERKWRLSLAPESLSRSFRV